MDGKIGGKYRAGHSRQQPAYSVSLVIWIPAYRATLPIHRTAVPLNSKPHTQRPNTTESQRAEKPIPLVSILIRSMDRASLLDALASVAKQTYASIEVVLVNAKGDGHGDVSQWCGRFPIRFVNSSTRHNRSAAANLGLEQSHGEYLIFLDDDDLIDAEHIESLVNALIESPHCKAAFSGTRIADDSGATLGVYNQAFSSAQLLVGNYLPIHAVLFSRDLVTVGCRFDATLETYEDWDFWLQVSRHTGFAQTGKITAVYRSFLGNSGMSSAEHRPLQRQRRSVVWRKWWPTWNVENLDLLASGLEKDLEEKAKENTGLRAGLGLQIDKNAQLIHDNAQLTNEFVGLQISLNEQVSSLGQTIAKLQANLAHREGDLVNQREQIVILNASIQKILTSNSWKFSAPIRHIGRMISTLSRNVRRGGLVAKSMWHFLRRDSLATELKKVYSFSRQEGWTGMKQLLTEKTSAAPSLSNDVPRAPDRGLEPSLLARPERHDFQPLASIDVDKYEYFFIDVFDTAVIRLFEKPVDIFKYIGHVTHSVDFEVKRVQQELATRALKSSHKDIKLIEIYETFSGTDSKIEVDAELKFCIRHPEIFAFYAGLVSKGKKIYFVSDMYLEKETLAEILNLNGYVKFNDIFVSSEDDFIKGDGSRFAWLRKTLPDSVNSAIHIGDNRISDWVQPRKHGYDAFQYKESIEFYGYDAFLFSKTKYLVEQDSLGISFILGMFKYWKSSFLGREPGYWKQFGFFYGGALVSAFCGFLNNKILGAQLSTSRIFFLARDGEIMSKVYRLLYSEYDAIYLLASRRCMSFPSLNALDSADDRETLKLFTTPIGIASADDLMDRFGYDDLHELKKAFVCLESSGLLDNESEIQECIIDNKDSILPKANAERHALLQYLETMRFFEDADIVIADVGWGGSIQNAIMKLLKQSARADKRLHGIYLGVGDHVAHEDFKTGFLFQGDKSGFAEFLNLIELITSSPCDGVVRITESNGEYSPISPAKNAEELNRQSVAADIQAGILEFAQILKDKNIGNLDFLQPSDFAVLFDSLQRHPSAEDVEQLGGVKHAMTLGSHFAEQVLRRKE